MDFTIKQYKQLLESLIKAGFFFKTYTDFIKQPNERAIILRQDVDDKKNNSLTFARIQAEKGIHGTYYFRALPQSWDKEVVKEIHSLGHEVGYHYESVTTCNGDIEKAYVDFVQNLKKFRELTPITTICMHGSPSSRYDNKALWNHYDYRSLGIIGEPYLDINFDDVFYLTDTGRRWDGWKVSVRDKIFQQEVWNENGLVFHSTNDIIRASNEGKLPNKIMMTFHPQRWNNKALPWLNELIWQNTKNTLKYFLIKVKWA